MAKNKKLIAGLQDIITALSQHADGNLIQSRIFAAQGLNKLAEKCTAHATEERGYVEQCIDRLIDLGEEVKNEAKEETPVCYDAIEWIKYELQLSKDGLDWLAGILEEARTDYTTFDLLKEYYQDEEEDMYWSEQQLELIEKIGKNNWYATLL